MKALACADVRRQLAAFHDHELTLEQEVRIGGHVHECARCAAELADLRALGSALRTPPRVLPSDDEASALAVAVLAEVRVQRELTVHARLRHAVWDWHVVFAGLGAAVLTVASVVSIVTLIGAATDQRPDSLAALVDSMAMPELISRPAIDGDTETRWNERFRQANETAEQEAVFALSEAVARDDRLAPREGSRRGRASTRTTPADPAASGANIKHINDLLDLVSRARFEPAREVRFSALPWLAISTTVRAAKPQPVATPIGVPKRRAFTRPFPSARA